MTLANLQWILFKRLLFVTSPSKSVAVIKYNLLPIASDHFTETFLFNYFHDFACMQKEMSRQSKRVLKNWLISSQSIDIKQKYQTLRKTRLIVRSSPMSFHALYSKTGNYVDWRVVHSIAQLAVKSFDSKHFNLPLLKTKITNSTAICDWHWCILHRIWSGVDINWVNKKKRYIWKYERLNNNVQNWPSQHHFHYISMPLLWSLINHDLHNKCERLIKVAGKWLKIIYYWQFWGFFRD